MADVADRRDIYKIAVGMFAAVPGLLYLDQLADTMNAGLTTQGAYELLAGTLAFQSQAPGFGSGSSNADFADAFVQRLLGADASAAGKAFALDFVKAKLDSGLSRGHVIEIAIDTLDAVTHDDADFDRAAERFHQRMEFAQHETEILKTSAEDLHVLQTLLADGTSGLSGRSSQSIDVAAVPAEANQDTAPRGGITIDMSGQAQSVLFLGASGKDHYTSSRHGDTIDAAGGADTINLTDAGGVPAAGKMDTLIFGAGDSQLTTTVSGHDIVNNFATASGGGALDVIDLGAFGFTGQQVSALANHGALDNTVVNGTTLSQPGFFVMGAARAVAIGTSGVDTFVFVDVDKDGSFNASTDLFFQLVGVTDITLANFGF